MTKIQDGVRFTVITVEEGKGDKKTIEAERYVIISERADGQFTITHNQLRSNDLLGFLKLASLQLSQDFIAKNYGVGSRG